MCNRIRHLEKNEGSDITKELKQEIEDHFENFWENDRKAVIIQKKSYFDLIPYKIQEYIMCDFLFEDVVKKRAFESFFRAGKEYDQ